MVQSLNSVIFLEEGKPKREYNVPTPTAVYFDIGKNTRNTKENAVT